MAVSLLSNSIISMVLKSQRKKGQKGTLLLTTSRIRKQAAHFPIPGRGTPYWLSGISMRSLVTSFTL